MIEYDRSYAPLVRRSSDAIDNSSSGGSASEPIPKHNVDRRETRLDSSIVLMPLAAAVFIAAILLPGPALADHPCSTDPSEADYDPLCEQEGEVACNPLVPTSCLECWDCIDNDGDGLFDCMDNLDLEGNVNTDGNCATYCEFVNPIGSGAYDQDQDDDGFLACPWGPPEPAPPIYDCDDNESSINSGATEDCGDGLDNDCDGLVDAADSDCGGGDDDDSTPGDDDDSAPGDDDSTPGDDDDNGDDDGCSCSTTQSTVSTGLGLALLLGGLGLLRRRSRTRATP